MLRLLAFIGGLSLSTLAVPAGAASILDRLQEESELSVFAAALQKSELADKLAGPGEITLFAPSDRAMRKQGSTFLLETVLVSDGNRQRLSELLMHHAVRGLRLQTGAIAEAKEVDTLARVCLRIERFGSAMKVGPEAVVTKRLEADNGVIYVIDRMLWVPWQGATSCGDMMLQVGSAS